MHTQQKWKPWEGYWTDEAGQMFWAFVLVCNCLWESLMIRFIQSSPRCSTQRVHVFPTAQEMLDFAPLHPKRDCAPKKPQHKMSHFAKNNTQGCNALGWSWGGLKFDISPVKRNVCTCAQILMYFKRWLEKTVWCPYRADCDFHTHIFSSLF